MSPTDHAGDARSSTGPEPGHLAARVADDRRRTLARIAALEREQAVLFAATADAPDDEHDPEGATIGFERAQVSALLAAAHERLGELDEVADRVARGSYGTCERCGGPIGDERLAARPTARRCVACAGQA